MRKVTTRRTVLRGAGLGALGATGFGTVFGAERLSARTGNRPPAGNAQRGVVSKVGDGVIRVEGKMSGWIRPEGFPEGWQVAVGDRVVVAPSVENTGVAAFPRIHWVSVTAAPADLTPGARLGHSGGPEITAATIVDEGLIAQRRAGAREAMPLMAAVADHVASYGPERVVAIRKG
jgi:hypothetical protein